MTNLQSLLRGMNPVLNPGVYVFCGTDSAPAGALAWFHEVEGVTVLEKESEAVANGRAIKFRCRWITLTVESDLMAVGFLAAVTAALGKAQIPCNVISAVHHDHLFIPTEKAEEAMDVLRSLQERAEDTE